MYGKPMSEITIPEVTLTEEQLNQKYLDLAMEVVLQGVRDYCYSKSKRTRKIILEDLRSKRLNLYTDGLSSTAADKLEHDLETVIKNVKCQSKELKKRGGRIE